MHLLSRASVVLFGLIVLGALTGCDHIATPSARPLLRKIPLGMHLWTFQGSIVLAYRRETPPGSGIFAQSRSTAHVWFEPLVGFRLAVEPADGQGGHQLIYGTDGVTIWAYDQAANRYTLKPSNPRLADPRPLLDLETGGSTDLNSAIAALEALRLPDRTVMLEGTDTVVGRLTEIVLIAPYACSGTGSASGSTTTGITGTAVTGPATEGSVTPVSNSAALTAGTSFPVATVGNQCTGAARYWLDTESGWVLQVEADDGRGGGFSLHTDSANFGIPIDASLYQFTPPPGSVEVDVFEN